MQIRLPTLYLEVMNYTLCQFYNLLSVFVCLDKCSTCVGFLIVKKLLKQSVYLICLSLLASKMADQDDILAKERDEKFKKWLQNKTLRDKAFDYLKQLDTARAENVETLKDVAVSMQAVDRIMGTGDGSHDDDDVDENTDANKKVSDQLLLYPNRILHCLT
jgi:hypothetical protein